MTADAVLPLAVFCLVFAGALAAMLVGLARDGERPVGGRKS